MSLENQIVHLVSTYGVWLVTLIVGLESAGIPLPGETTVVAAALYAGGTRQLNIGFVVMAAAAGAIIGDNVGFWVGRRFGYRWIVHHQSRLHLTPRRLRLGQYLFLRHGGKVVFFGRFVAVLRMLAGLLAGINCMDWTRFLFFNAAGAIVWASIYGFGAYLFGRQLTNTLSSAAILIAGVVVVLAIIGVMFVRKHEERWADEAERALQGPLQP